MENKNITINSPLKSIVNPETKPNKKIILLFKFFLIILSAKYKKNIFKKTWIEIEDICKHEIICKGKKINIYEENILIFLKRKKD